MIIDFHTHVVPPVIKERREDYLHDACFSSLYSQPKAKLATIDELIASMDEQGVDKSVILNLGWTTHELCVETNDYILEAIARYPKRLIGFCAVQPLAGDEALKELERCAKNGAKGIGEIRPDIQGFNLSDSASIRPFIVALVENGLILLAHASEPVGHQYFGKGKITPDILYPLIVAFPELKLVCAHWGGGLPFYALMPEVAAALRNVYFDTAATPFLYRPEIFRHMVDIIGSHKILFGSDFPLMPPKRVVDQIEAAGLSFEDKSRILAKNALDLLAVRE